MQRQGNVAIFWDFENCRPASNISGYAIVENIRCVAQTFGSIQLFKAYLELCQQPPSPRFSSLRSELQASGVSLTDCPHNGRKEVADKMMIVDMIAHAIDNPAPSTIILISSDRDFAYAVSILRLRRYRVVVISPAGAHNSLIAQASVHLDWSSEVMGQSSLDAPLPFTSSPNSRPPPTTPRRRSDSTSNTAFVPSKLNTRYTVDGRDTNEDICGSYGTSLRDTNRESTGVNGLEDNYASPRYTHTTEAGPSIIPRMYSPSATFQTAKSSPPTPPAAYNTPGPVIVTAKNVLHQGTQTPSLPKGFPFSEPEPIASMPIPPTLETTTTITSSNASHLPLERPLSTVQPPTGARHEAQAILTPVDPAQGHGISPVFPQPRPAVTKLSSPAFQTATWNSSAPTPAAFAGAASNVASSSSAPSTSTAAKNSPLNASFPSGNIQDSSPRPVLPQFQVMVQALKDHNLRVGSPHGARIDRSVVGSYLSKHPKLYQQAGTTGFAAYIALAEKAGIVTVGGTGNTQWIALLPAAKS